MDRQTATMAIPLQGAFPFDCFPAIVGVEAFDLRAPNPAALRCQFVGVSLPGDEESGSASGRWVSGRT